MTSRRAKGSDTEEGRGPRLDGYLSRAGLASRKQARALIKQGRVTVAGEICRDASRRIEGETVALDDAPVDSPVERADFLMHKPVGVACSHDEREAPLVFDLLDETLRRRSLKIAGRLDRETSGLLVLTTDGDFTTEGRALRERVEVSTDRQCAPIIDALGDDYDTVVEALSAWGRSLRAAHAYPQSGPHELAERASR